jgi:hypothetical protein
MSYFEKSDFLGRGLLPGVGLRGGLTVLGPLGLGGLFGPGIIRSCAQLCFL